MPRNRSTLGVPFGQTPEVKAYQKAYRLANKERISALVVDGAAVVTMPACQLGAILVPR